MVLELKGVSKAYMGVKVLKEIHLVIRRGEVHVLLGVNGAGKSTLIKVITGVEMKDSGEVLWKGDPLKIRSPVEAMELGIASVYQELNVIQNLLIWEYLFLGRERHHFYLMNRKEMKENAKKYLRYVGLEMDVETPVASLGMGQQQLVEIARALSMNAKLLILDEPTSSLGEAESAMLLTLVNELKHKGMAILYISHKLEELKKIGDQLSFLRDGRLIGTYSMTEMTSDFIIQHMVDGKTHDKSNNSSKLGKVGLEVRDFRVKGNAHSINLKAFQGQLLGITGLVGAGRTEFVRGVFGADPIDSGERYIFGKKVKIDSPLDAVSEGMAFIPENRKEEGLLLNESIEFNVTLPLLKRFHWLDQKKLDHVAYESMGLFQIYPSIPRKCVKELSGGNQQKVVMAKWISYGAKIYLFDEPTRGIDIKAKRQIYQILYSLLEGGAIVIVISSEFMEVLEICDRVILMKDGKIVGDHLSRDLNQETIMRVLTGGF